MDCGFVFDGAKLKVTNIYGRIVSICGFSSIIVPQPIFLLGFVVNKQLKFVVNLVSKL